MATLVTGAAGFIGYHVAERLLARGDSVVGVDNLNDYYDPRLKGARLERPPTSRFTFALRDTADRGQMACSLNMPRRVVLRLRKQACAIRSAIRTPTSTNVLGFLHVLEGCRTASAAPVFASPARCRATTRLPFGACSDSAPADFLRRQQAGRREMAHAYAQLYGLPCTGLRLFTVYGPWGRPDMALFKFTRAILAGEPIEVFNHGRMRRDFTYIDDVAEAILRVLDQPAAANPEWSSDTPDPSSSTAPYRIYNVGNNQPVELLVYIDELERRLGKRAIMTFMPMQPGDIESTRADSVELASAIGLLPRTTVTEGIARFVDWYLEFHNAEAADG